MRVEKATDESYYYVARICIYTRRFLLIYLGFFFISFVTRPPSKVLAISCDSMEKMAKKSLRTTIPYKKVFWFWQYISLISPLVKHRGHDPGARRIACSAYVCV